MANIEQTDRQPAEHPGTILSSYLSLCEIYRTSVETSAFWHWLCVWTGQWWTSRFETRTLPRKTRMWRELEVWYVYSRPNLVWGWRGKGYKWEDSCQRIMWSSTSTQSWWNSLLTTQMLLYIPGQIVVTLLLTRFIILMSFWLTSTEDVLVQHLKKVPAIRDRVRSGRFFKMRNHLKSSLMVTFRKNQGKPEKL